jgi:dihydropteroate synthase
MTWTWTLARRELLLGEVPQVMGILNVTPDSFSDGGRHPDVAAAVAHGLDLVRDGAAILDVGGESTRPGAAEVPVEEEIRRVVPVVRALAERIEIPISVDTRKAPVARAAIEAGAEIVNDVSGLAHDPDMVSVIAGARCGAVLMHMRGTPETMQRDTRYDDVVGEVSATLAAALDRCRAHGIPDDRVVLDPGVGFGKDVDDNFRLLAYPKELRALGRPLLVGVSRKSVFKTLLGLEVHERDLATVAATAVSSYLGVALVRVHDVRAAVQAVWVGAAMRGVRLADLRGSGATAEARP